MQPQEFYKYANAQIKRLETEQERMVDLAAFIVTSLYNAPPLPVIMVKGRQRKAYKMEDFTGRKTRQRRKQQTPEQMLAVVKALNKLYGGSAPEGV